jgi:hypothetical protein
MSDKFIKKIWTYWTGPIPDLLLTCKYSWKEHLVGWDIKWLTKETLCNYNIPLPSNFNTLHPSAQSDIIRLGLLYEYGGIWLDATIILNRDLDWLIQIALLHPKDSYFTYQTKGLDHFENWLISVPNDKNPDILKLRNALMDVLHVWPEVEDTIYYKKKYTSNGRYFMTYQVYCYLKHNDDSFKGAVLLPNSVLFAFLPVVIPFGLDPRYLLKFTSEGRRLKMLYTLLFYMIIYVSIMLFIRYLI